LVEVIYPFLAERKLEVFDCECSNELISFYIILNFTETMEYSCHSSALLRLDEVVES
jgi:hypothetical protein